MSSQLIGTLIEQCDREIEKAKSGREKAKEIVEADISKVCFENGILNGGDEKVQEIRRKYRPGLLRTKILGYDIAINRLELLKAELSSAY